MNTRNVFFPLTIFIALFTLAGCGPTVNLNPFGGGATDGNVSTSGASSSGSTSSEMTSGEATTGSSNPAETGSDSTTSGDSSSGNVGQLDDTGESSSSGAPETDGSGSSGDVGDFLCEIETDGPDNIAPGDDVILMEFSILCAVDLTARNTELVLVTDDGALAHLNNFRVGHAGGTVAGPVSGNPDAETNFTEDYEIQALMPMVLRVLVSVEDTIPSGTGIQVGVRFSDGDSDLSHFKDDDANEFVPVVELSAAGANYLLSPVLVIP